MNVIFTNLYLILQWHKWDNLLLMFSLRFLDAFAFISRIHKTFLTLSFLSALSFCGLLFVEILYISCTTHTLHTVIYRVRLSNSEDEYVIIIFCTENWMLNSRRMEFQKGFIIFLLQKKALKELHLAIFSKKIQSNTNSQKIVLNEFNFYAGFPVKILFWIIWME